MEIKISRKSACNDYHDQSLNLYRKILRSNRLKRVKDHRHSHKPEITFPFHTLPIFPVYIPGYYPYFRRSSCIPL